MNASLPVLLDDGTRKYVWGLGLAYAVESSGNVLVYHTDALESVRALSDGAGLVLQAYRYDEYGLPLVSEGGVEQPFRYTGEQTDEATGLVYLRARMYEPDTGRLTARDVVAGIRGTARDAEPLYLCTQQPGSYRRTRVAMLSLSRRTASWEER